MNNNSVLELLDNCENEISAIENLITGLGISSNVVPYLSKYGLIKACGTIEQAFKTVVADKCAHRSKQQIKNFITKSVRNNSSNPSFTNICNLLNKFDESWKDSFKQAVLSHSRPESLKTSLQSLVDARNEFAHGGNPRVSISDVSRYYSDSRIIIEFLDRVVG